MFIQPHEVEAPTVDPTSTTVRISRALLWVLVPMAAAGIGTGSWWFISKHVISDPAGPKNQNVVISSTHTTNPVNVARRTVRDSDGDGLDDDAEVWYGTDIAATDSDGDGYSDGDEVKNGYEPLNNAAGITMIDTALVTVIEKSVQRPVVVSSGISSDDRQRYYFVYDGASTAYFSADGSLVAQCTVDDHAGKCDSIPNSLHTDFSRSYSDGLASDSFHVPF